MDHSYSNQLSFSSISNSKNYLILFLIWPFLAFITALTNYSQRDARKVVYLFLIYYGLAFFIGNDFMDAARNAARLRTTAALPFSDFFEIVSGIYSADNNVMDVVDSLIVFIVSRFTDKPNILFAVYAAVQGYFYLKSIDLLHDRYQANPVSNALIFLFFFICILPITTINGFRMWAAAWIFFYGAYHVILYRDGRYLLLTLSSSLVHWSFLSANAILIIYYFLGNRNIIYLPLAILSFILPQFLAPFFRLLSLRLGGGIQGRYEGYSSEGYVLSQQESLETASWFIKIGNELVFYFFLLAIIIINIKSRNLEKDKGEENLFSFLLLFLSFVNFGKSIPSFGERFMVLFFLFATLYLFLYFVKLQEVRINPLTWIGLLPMSLYAAINFRIGSASINAWILTPGLGLPWFVPGVSIENLLF